MMGIRRKAATDRLGASTGTARSFKGGPKKYKRHAVAWFAVAILFVVPVAIFIAGCGGSSFLGVPIYPGAEKVDIATTMMQPPNGNAGDSQSQDGGSATNGQTQQQPAGDSNTQQPPSGNSGTNGQPPEPPSGDSNAPQPPSGDSGTNGQSPEPPTGNSSTSGQNMAQNNGATYWTEDSMEEAVTWYTKQLSGKTGYSKKTMELSNKTSNNETTSEEASTEAAPVVITFKSGTSTKMVMISKNNENKGGTYITISDDSTNSSDQSSTGETKSTFIQDGGKATKTGESYKAGTADTSAVTVDNSGTLTLLKSKITKSGNTSSNDQSSFVGLNAAVLVQNGGTLKLSDSMIKTTGTGANGVFAYGEGSSVVLSDVTIKATAQGGHAVMATGGGTVTCTDVDMDTAGTNSGAIATDRGGGTIKVKGGNVVTTGQDSPGIYSTGDISVTGADIESTGSEVAVIEGSNSITLKNCTLLSTMKDKWGVMLMQSMSGDAEGVNGVFKMAGGSLSYTAESGPLFFVTNSSGTIKLTGVKVAEGSGVVLKAAADRWGASGSNGGNATFTVSKQTLTGDMVADSVSSINATLKNGSSLSGKINADNSAKTINLTLDATSTWNVTGDSYLTSLSDSGGISGASITNITGNGHTVYYDSVACSELGGKTYTLAGGGTLTPK